MRIFASLSLAALALASLAIVTANAQQADPSQVAQTPPMGWNSWNFFAEKVTDKNIRDSADQIVATGYLRNSMLNEEGGIDPEQFRMEAMFDRMDAIGKGILGLTIQCTQCHDHKYDPLSQAEYYRMFAFLNNDNEACRTVYTAEQQRKIAELTGRIHAVEASPHPEQALHSADILGRLAPTSGHMVHMPGHIFYRTGDYASAKNSFAASIEADEHYMQSQHVDVDDDDLAGAAAPGDRGRRRRADRIDLQPHRVLCGRHSF